MEKLFALSGIGVLDMVDLDGTPLKIAYHNVVIEKRVLIVMHEDIEYEEEYKERCLLEAVGDELPEKIVGSYISAVTFDAQTS